jgi:hypothetical protein
LKIRTIPASSLREAARLDTKYFLSQSVEEKTWPLRARAAGFKFVRISAVGKAWAPKRFKRAYAVAGEPSVPYLRPHDVFYYLPQPADLLSRERSEDLESYQLRKGTILQTCSGRNLGPAVMVDAWLERFVLSHDMVRVEVTSERLRYYVLAYLKTTVGQKYLRRDKTGSVIDHVTEDHIGQQEIPIPSDDVVDDVVKKMKAAVRLREKARLQLAQELETFAATLPELRTHRGFRMWTAKARQFDGRLDAAYYDPAVQSIRKRLRAGGGVLVSDVAEVLMLGRYKRLYSDAEHGRRIVSGAQLLQSSPVHVQYILPESFDDVGAFELREGWIAYPSDGRAEEALGTPVVITRDKAGWLASNMVGRVIPKARVDVGWLYAALKSAQCQVQLKAFSSGSVVDHTYPADMARVVLPSKGNFDGTNIMTAWRMLGAAQEAEDETIRQLDQILSLGGSLSPN